MKTAIFGSSGKQGAAIVHSEKDHGSRYVCLDVLKALAILLVVFQHNFYVPYSITEQPGVWNYVHDFIRAIMSCHVTVFFFVNGALLLTRPMNLKRHIIRTMKLILMIYLWAVLTLVLLSLLRGVGFPSLVKVIQQVWNWDNLALNHFWFLRTMALIYIIFPVIKVIWDRFRPVYWLLLGFMVLVIFGDTFLSMGLNALKVLRGGAPYSGWYGFLGFLSPLRSIHGVALTYFMLGGLLWEKRELLSRKNLRKWASVVFPVSCGLLFFYACIISKYAGSNWDIIFRGYSTVFTLMGVLCLYTMALGLEQRNHGPFVKLLQLVGQNTLGIFYLHVVFGGVLAPYYKMLPGFDLLPVNLIYTIFIVLLSLAVTVLLKKVPVVRKIME